MLRSNTQGLELQHHLVGSLVHDDWMLAILKSLRHPRAYAMLIGITSFPRAGDYQVSYLTDGTSSCWYLGIKFNHFRMRAGLSHLRKVSA